MAASLSARPRSAGLLLAGCLLAVALSLPLAVLLGVADVPLADSLATLSGGGSAMARSILLEFRLPRVATGVLAGINLAVSGLLLQRITRNPLADPSILGISQGATLAVAVFLLVTVYSHAPGGNTLPDLPVAWLPAVGLVGGLCAAGLVHLLALRHELGPIRVTLCGVAVGALLHALAMGVIAGWGSTRVEILLEWLAGSLYARSWDHALFLAPFTMAGLALLPVLLRPLDLLGLEAAAARSFGLSYRRAFTAVLCLASGLAASAVGAVGPIAFVGLLVPHLARFVVAGHRALLVPVTVMLGAVVVTAGDLAGRLIGGADEIPIGVVTALLGVPVLILLLRKTP
ncbi:FecCD family ABC transporter permease [Novispirillum itersonii]|uniref:Iron complex transport system permease protein n=1 Tax=Novispirillum itersonii TaxID=189 RepID=A0A7X0DN78_NOVIT|nr:iron ABC transporter permease [Novispirillum itersonii]MBB6211069.1 iron complex transport system permease protein [Novispirillum itersonii]